MGRPHHRRAGSKAPAALTAPEILMVRAPLSWMVAGLAVLLLACPGWGTKCEYPPYDCPCKAGEAGCKIGPGAYYCSDLSTEPDCGACNTVCGSGSCVGGACVCAPPPVKSCPPPPGWVGEAIAGFRWTVCRDVTVEGNCGDCGVSCGPLGSCVSGACVCAPPPVKYCPPPPELGWLPACADVTSDIFNCGDCGIVCPPVENGQLACSDGVCAGIAFCYLAYADCDGDYANGCETDTGSDVKNCGACAATCPAGHTCICGTGDTCKHGACCPSSGDLVCHWP